MNKAFGTNIRITFLPGPDMARVVNQVATEFSAGQRAHVDLVLGAAPQIAPVVKVNFFEPVDWTRYLPGRITADMTELDGKIIRIATGLSGVTYNSQLAPMQPRVLDDFLRPEWKGKIASTPYAAGLDVLLADDVWGKQKTVSYVRALTKQIAGMTRCGETERIATGEYLALVMDCTGQDALLWQEKGAPVAQLMPLDAAQQRYYYFAVPKNAQTSERRQAARGLSVDPGRTGAGLRHLENRSAFHAGLEDGRHDRRLSEGATSNSRKSRRNGGASIRKSMPAEAS